MAEAPTLDEFQQEVTAFLDANAERKEAERAEKKFVWGEGSDDVALFEEIDREKETPRLGRAQAWRAKRYDAGLGWISGPKEFGGRELSRAHERVYSQAEAQYRVPEQTFFGIGLGMVAPTILAHAQPHVQERYLPKLYRGDIVGLTAVQRAGRRQRPREPADARPTATATSGSSPARRSGPRARTTATSARSSAAPTPICPSTRASPVSSST